MCVTHLYECMHVQLVCNYVFYSDAVTELSQEIVLFGSEVLNSLWVTLAEQLRISGTMVKEVSTTASYIVEFSFAC